MLKCNHVSLRVCIGQARRYISESQGQQYAEGLVLDLDAMLAESDPRTPMVCLLSMGSDPTENIERLAKSKVRDLKEGPGSKSVEGGNVINGKGRKRKQTSEDQKYQKNIYCKKDKLVDFTKRIKEGLINRGKKGDYMNIPNHEQLKILTINSQFKLLKKTTSRPQI